MGQDVGKYVGQDMGQDVGQAMGHQTSFPDLPPRPPPKPHQGGSPSWVARPLHEPKPQWLAKTPLKPWGLDAQLPRSPRRAKPQWLAKTPLKPWGLDAHLGQALDYPSKTTGHEKEGWVTISTSSGSP